MNLVNIFNNFPKTVSSFITNFRVGPELPSQDIICSGACPTFKIENKEDIAKGFISIANLMVYVAVLIAILMVIWTGFMILIGQVKEPFWAIANIFIGLGIILAASYLTNGFANLVQDIPALLNTLFNGSR